MTPYALGHKASYATYSDGILWIGEYMDGEDQGASSVRRDLRASARLSINVQRRFAVESESRLYLEHT